MTLFLAIGNRLEERHIADIPVVQSSPHLPFYATPTISIIDYLYGNIVKFVFGFEYSRITDGGQVISPQSSQMAIMFLACLCVSYQAALLSRQSGL